ncbi:cilia- and flagella-associated protein 45 isoform X1 [Acanthopagrus latus]|uniref:cilia- and flagella-associated protein 45 isoform X1 n=1 Tax=Acanthopagrus latus TaxID=8177 RepID=UPI00187CCA2C|nr:cilia- and flagella-associated protein 45 isoform X1 [Acanthopagrus latus]
MSLGSSSRTSRSRSHSHRYRKRAPISEVDESLFGSPKSVSALLDKRGNSASKAKNESQKKQDTIQIITKDLIRNLRIPCRDPSKESLILPPAEFERITALSRVPTKEEKEARAHQRRKEEEMRAVEEAKRRIFNADLSRKENKVLTQLEIEARDRDQRLLEQASALRMEQEEEIKLLNSMIMGAQCQATRDVQIQEKKQIQAELLEEEKRLDVMMEVERRKALETEEEIEELRKNQMIRGKQQIFDQIQNRREAKILDDELKECERKQTRENQERMNQEDLKVQRQHAKALKTALTETHILRALEKKREEQQKLQEEVMHINAETMRAKEQRKEEEKLADMRDMEYIKSKLEREAEYEAEQRRIKKEKELEIARLRAQQEKARDYKAEQDELRARRDQDRLHREWRRKEKELAEKKAQEEAMLREARLEQVHCKEHFLSIEAGREKAEFERVLKVQQEAIIKQKEEEEKQRQKAHRRAEAIRQQVKERELSAIAKRRQIFQEADRLIEEAQQRRARLNEIKEKKLRELKATGLSEKYCSEVEKKSRAYVL